MSTTNIILSTPHNYDLQGLAETTRQTLELLRPWTLLAPSPSNPLVGEIVSKAAKYVSAVQMGVSAAYSGFTVTEEVLFLASALPIEDQDDLQQYLVGMMDLAREARENANNAFQAFRNVRVEIIETMSKLTEQLKASQQPGGQSHSTPAFPKYDKAELDVLVKFSEYLSNYANWWDWIKVETDPSPSTKDLPVAFQLDSLTDPEAVKRWKHLRSQFTAYVQMIGELEDADPEFFNRAASPDSSAQNASSQAIIPGSSSSLSNTASSQASSSAFTPTSTFIDITHPSPNPISTNHVSIANTATKEPAATPEKGCQQDAKPSHVREKHGAKPPGDHKKDNATPPQQPHELNKPPTPTTPDKKLMAGFLLSLPEKHPRLANCIKGILSIKSWKNRFWHFRRNATPPSPVEKGGKEQGAQSSGEKKVLDKSRPDKADSTSSNVPHSSPSTSSDKAPKDLDTPAEISKRTKSLST